MINSQPFIDENVCFTCKNLHVFRLSETIFNKIGKSPGKYFVGVAVATNCQKIDPQKLYF